MPVRLILLVIAAVLFLIAFAYPFFITPANPSRLRLTDLGLAFLAVALIPGVP